MVREKLGFWITIIIFVDVIVALWGVNSNSFEDFLYNTPVFSFFYLNGFLGFLMFIGVSILILIGIWYGIKFMKPKEKNVQIWNYPNDESINFS